MRYLIVLLFLVGCNEKRPKLQFNIGDNVIVLQDGYKNCKYGTVMDFRQSNCCTIADNWRSSYNVALLSKNNAKLCPESNWFNEKFLIERNDAIDYEVEAKKRGFR